MLRSRTYHNLVPALCLLAASGAIYCLVLLLTPWRPPVSVAPGLIGWFLPWFAGVVLMILGYYLITSGFVARLWGGALTGLRSIGLRAGVVAVMFVAGAFAGEALGLMPPADEWSSLSVPVLRAAALYLACFISPIAVYFAVQQLGHIRRGRTATKKAAFNELAKQHGRPVARMLLLAPWLMAGAQAVSFVTSLLGLNMLWGAVPDELWVALHLPVHPAFAALFALEDGIVNIELSRLTVLALLASAVLSCAIWFMGCLAVARVREGKPVPMGVFALVIVFGLISTYTADLMWAGQVTSREELRAGFRDTEMSAADINQADLRLLQPLSDAVGAQIDDLAGALAAKRRAALSEELAPLRQAIRAIQRHYGDIADRLPPLRDYAALYRASHECEIASGCLTQLAGRGPVARNLLVLAEGFARTAATWAELLAQHATLLEAAAESGQAVELALAADQFDVARRALDALHGNFRALRAASPMPILAAVRLQSSRPVSEDFSMESALHSQQRDALAKLDADLAALHATVVELIGTTASNLVQPPVRVAVSSLGRDLVVELFHLNNLGGFIDELLYSRRASVERILRDISSLTAAVDTLPSGPELINERDVIAQKLNTVRLRLSDTLEPIDVGPLQARAEKLKLVRQHILPLVAEMRVPEQAALPEFRLMPLHLAVLRYAHLSIVSLLVQLTLDFLVTLGLAYGIYLCGTRREESWVRRSMGAHGDRNATLRAGFINLFPA